MTDAAIKAADTISWHAHARVLKFNPDQVRFAARKSGLLVAEVSRPHLLAARLAPEAITDADGNVLTTGGVTAIISLVSFTTSAAGQAFGPVARAGLGVGATSTTGLAADTALGSNGASAYYQGVDAANPTESAGTINANATFASGNGNFAWNEWCMFTAAGAITPGATLASVGTTPVMWNHKAGAALLGTKVSGAVWVLQASMTIA